MGLNILTSRIKSFEEKSSKGLKNKTFSEAPEFSILLTFILRLYINSY